MQKDSQDKLFQIQEAARACGLSRSTLMRMEEKGLLKPAYTAPDSGRRYYDNYNVAHILQVEKFKAMGLSNEEIIAYYTSGGQISPLLSVLEARLEDLRRSVEELRIRAAGTNGISLSVQEFRLPEVLCCMKACMGRTPDEKYNAMFAFYSECVRKGYRLSNEPIFTMQKRDDFLNGYISTVPYPFYVCVPVQKEMDGAERLPACRAISVLYYGDYDHMDEAWLTLGREVKSRGLTPTGLPRVLGLVAPYTGREIAEHLYCSRLVLPVAEQIIHNRKSSRRQCRRLLLFQFTFCAVFSCR